MRLEARLLGTFEVTLDGRRIERAIFERPSGLRLLKLVLATPGHRLRREAAAEALWPELDPERSEANLRKATHFARRALGTSGDARERVLATDGPWLRLDRNLEVDVDVDRLLGAISVIEGLPGGTAGVQDDGHADQLGPSSALPSSAARSSCRRTRTRSGSYRSASTSSRASSTGSCPALGRPARWGKTRWRSPSSSARCASSRPTSERTGLPSSFTLTPASCMRRGASCEPAKWRSRQRSTRPPARSCRR